MGDAVVFLSRYRLRGGDLIYFQRIYFGFSPIKRVLVLQRPRTIIVMAVNPIKAVVFTKGSSSNWKESVNENEF